MLVYQRVYSTWGPPTPVAARLEPLLAGDPEVTALTALPTEDQVAMEMLGLPSMFDHQMITLW